MGPKLGVVVHPIGSMYVWYIYLHGWIKFLVNIGKYTSHMDPMGYINPLVSGWYHIRETHLFGLGGGLLACISLSKMCLRLNTWGVAPNCSIILSGF